MIISVIIRRVYGDHDWDLLTITVDKLFLQQIVHAMKCHEQSTLLSYQRVYLSQQFSVKSQSLTQMCFAPFICPLVSDSSLVAETL